MYTIGMTMKQVQVNTKFLNALPPEWSKFVTDVKLAKSLYTINYDQLYAYLSQHERHAKEVRLMRERYPDPLAIVANSQTLYNPSQSPQHSVPTMLTQQSQAEFPQLDSGLVVPTFQQGEDPIDCINKAMAFISAVTSRFPPSNNQLKTSSNPRNQATIQDGRFTIQQTEDLDAYDLDCDDISLAKVVLMANLSSYDLKVLSEVPYYDTYPNDMINQDVEEMMYSEQTHIVDFPDNEINKQAFWLKHSNHTFDTSVKSHTPIRTEAPSELPKCLELEIELLKKKDFIEKDVYDKLDNSGENQNAPIFNQLLEINELKAQSQEKDTVIRKLKDRIKSLSGKDSVENVKKDIDEIETINIELEHIQEKVFAIAALKNELRKLKGKNIVNTADSKPIATTISPGLYKINLEPLAPKLLKNKDAHIDYIKHSRDHADTLWEIVKNARALSRLDSNLDSAYDVDLLKGSRGSNLYTLSLENLLLSSPICLLSKASMTKSWLWHRRLSHLNFDYITSLAKQGLVLGIPKLKYKKDHLCSAYALGKNKKHSNKPKAEDSIQDKLYLLHMDLCWTKRIQSNNGRKYVGN
ncbi:retrovirus-related pol polyprotein from transposon TNT 1-94 [Tanacetum coccineum]